MGNERAPGNQPVMPVQPAAEREAWMVNNGQSRRQAPGDWDVYWTGTHENAAHQEGGPQERVLADFWDGFFSGRRGAPRLRLLDMACGNGAVTGFARRRITGVDAFCLDTSLSALLELEQRYPRTGCVAADALRTPFADGSFDMVVSQFGIEYAGMAAFDEAARLVSSGGQLGAIVHLHGGAIYRECRDNLKAIDRIVESRLLKLARNAFKAGFALNAGTGSVKAFKTAEKRLKPAIRSLESLVNDMGRSVASGLAHQLHRDIAHMYRRMSAFDRNEVIAWLDGMVRELRAYRGRMSSMMDAAMDDKAVDGIGQKLTGAEFTLEQMKTLNMGPGREPAAWAIVARRRA